MAMCLNVIRVSVESENFAHVQNYVQKASQVPDLNEPVVLAKLGCAAGLAALESRKYKLAARKFTELGVELGNSYEEVISPQDVAEYGGLCALASLDRAELKERVLDNISFRAALEAGVFLRPPSSNHLHPFPFLSLSSNHIHSFSISLVQSDARSHELMQWNAGPNE